MSEEKNVVHMTEYLGIFGDIIECVLLAWKLLQGEINGILLLCKLREE
jgi:hypothetical protein